MSGTVLPIKAHSRQTPLPRQRFPAFTATPRLLLKY